MKYQKPSLVYLDDATTAIQGDPGGPVKAGIVGDSTNPQQSSTAAGYPVEE